MQQTYLPTQVSKFARFECTICPDDGSPLDIDMAVDPEVDGHAATQCDGGELHRADLVERLQNAITSRARAQAQQHARGTFRTVLVDD